MTVQSVELNSVKNVARDNGVSIVAGSRIISSAMNFTISKRKDLGSNRCGYIDTHVNIATARKELGRVHAFSLFVVTADSVFTLALTIGIVAFGKVVHFVLRRQPNDWVKRITRKLDHGCILNVIPPTINQDMDMRRLFIGIHVDHEEQPDLKEVCRKLRIGADKREMNLRWPPLENWHVTLKFLGPVEEAILPKIQDAMERAALRGETAEVRASGIGAFPDERHARVLYAGVARSQAILDLQQAVDEELSSLGFLAENEDYRPHITIARLRSSGSVTDLISPFVRKSFGKLKLRELVLFESIQAGAFPVYKPLSKAVLKTSETI